MSKKILAIVFTLFLAAALLPINAEAAKGDRVEKFAAGSIFVMSPAEMLDDNHNRVFINSSAEWEVNAQSAGDTNGDDIHMWSSGTDCKFRVAKLYSNSEFTVQCTNFQETKLKKYWSVEDKLGTDYNDSGAIIHCWSKKDDSDKYAATQRFYLVEDGDDDPETYYIKNAYSDKYLVPRGFFKDPDKADTSQSNLGDNWDMENGIKQSGCNLIQSVNAFQWHFHILNLPLFNENFGMSWMSELPDVAFLSHLSIPGSHDSGTANVEGSGNADVNNMACQKYSIYEQLVAGVRAFDIRTAENDDSDDFVLIHGYDNLVCHEVNNYDSGDKNLLLRSVLNEMIEFLEKKPTEALIVTLKLDAGADDKAVISGLANLLLNDYLDNEDNQDYFYKWCEDGNTSSMTSPRLNDVRGKIVLFTRVDFSDEMLGTDINRKLLRSYVGPDLSQWDDRYDDSKHYVQLIHPDSTASAGVKVWVQDDYQCVFAEKEEKFFNTIDQLSGKLQEQEKYKEVEIPDKTHFVFNYTSKTTGSKNGLTPWSGAIDMNGLIYHDDRFEASARVGIVMMDYVNKPLAERIISRNDKYTLDETRTVNVTWKYTADGWEASLGNILAGDDVYAVVTDAPDGKSAKLTLGGEDAAAYLIASEDETSPLIEITSGSSFDAAAIDRLVACGAPLTVTGENGAQLVFDPEALQGIDKQMGDSVTVKIEDVTEKYQGAQPAKKLLWTDEMIHEKWLYMAASFASKNVFSLSVTSDDQTINNFGGSVAAALPYELQEGEKAEAVSVWYLVDDGSMKELDCKYDAETQLAAFTATSFSKYVVGADYGWVNSLTRQVAQKIGRNGEESGWVNHLTRVKTWLNKLVPWHQRS